MMFVFDDVPWLRPFLSWSIAVGLVWLVIAAPCYLFGTGLQQVNLRLWAWRAKWLERLASRRCAQRGHLSELTLEVVRNAKLHAVDLTAYNAWRRPIDGAVSDLRGLIDANRQLDRSIGSAMSRIGSSVEALGQLDAAWHNPSPTGTKSDLASNEFRLRRAKINLFLCGPLLVTVLVANSLISSLVFKAVIPPVQTPFGAALPLSWVVAILIGVIEAGVGIAHGHAAFREEGDHRRLSVGLIGASLLGLAVIGVETYFYSLFASDSNAEPLPAFGVTIPLSVAFGLIGFILGSMLFYLSTLAYTNLMNISRYGGIARLLKRFKEIERTGKSWQRFVDDLREAENQTRSSIEEFRPLVDSFVGRSESSAQALTQRFEVERSTPPGWVASSLRQLTEEEAAALFSETQMWVAVACLAGIATFGLAVYGLVEGIGELPTWVSVAAASGFVLASLAVGHLWGQFEREALARDKAAVTSVRGSLVWTVPTLVVAGGWLFFVMVTVESAAACWALGLMTAFALLMVAAERKNASVPGFLRPIAAGWLYGGDALMRSVPPAIVGTLTIGLEFVGAALRLVARPFEWLLSRRRALRAPEAVA